MHLEVCASSGSAQQSVMKWPATYTWYFPLGMQLPPALQSLVSFHLGCSYARNNSKKRKWKMEQVTKFSEWKQTHVWMEPSKTSQTKWERHHNTFTPSLHLVPFCQLAMTPKKNSLSLFTVTKWTWYSVLLTPQLSTWRQFIYLPRSTVNQALYGSVGSICITIVQSYIYRKQVVFFPV